MLQPARKKVIKSKYVIWKLIKAAAIGLCTQLFKICECGRRGRGGIIKLLHLLLVFSLSRYTQYTFWSWAFVFHKRGWEQFPWKMAMLVLQWGHRGWSDKAARGDVTSPGSVSFYRPGCWKCISRYAVRWSLLTSRERHNDDAAHFMP